MKEIQIVSLLCFGMAAVLTDLHSGKIPNLLIGTGIFCAMSYQLMTNRILGLLLFLGGSFLPIVLLGGLFYYRMIGAGDIKMLCVVGGYVGPITCFNCMLWSLLFGGIISFMIVIRNRNIWQRLSCLGEYIQDCAGGLPWTPYRNYVEAKDQFCLSIPIFIGILCYAMGIYG